jgi:hypothetical protein
MATKQKVRAPQLIGCHRRSTRARERRARLAEQTGVDESTVVRSMKGEESLPDEVIAYLSDLWGLSVAYLMNWEDALAAVEVGGPRISGSAARGCGVMARKRSLSSQLFRAARIADDVEAVESGNPKRIARRAKNVVLGRALGRAGVWRKLWGR